MFKMDRRDIPDHLLQHFKPCRIYKQKDDAMIPHRVYDALMADGWYGRQDIVWAKKNCMPESVTDRCTKAHEYIFLLTKSAKYYYDAEAVKEPATKEPDKKVSANKYDNNDPKFATKKGFAAARCKDYRETGRNKRSVWTVSTQPYPGAHFATFPPKLIEPCILAGSSYKACEVCGAAWERVVEKGELVPPAFVHGKPKQCAGSGETTQGNMGTKCCFSRERKTTGWQSTCQCENNGTARSKVLDPFAGSGTTLMVAEDNGRDSIGIELNPEYCELIKQRMNELQPRLFFEGVQ